MKNWNRLFLVFAILSAIGWICISIDNLPNRLPTLDFTSIWDVTVFYSAIFSVTGLFVTDNRIAKDKQRLTIWKKKYFALKLCIINGCCFNDVLKMARSFDYKLTQDEVKYLYKAYFRDGRREESLAVHEFAKKVYGCSEAAKLASF